MKVNRVLQDLFATSPASWSAEEGFALVIETLDRLRSTILSQHYREQPTNAEVQTSGLNMIPEETADRSFIDSEKKQRKRHKVVTTGDEQRKLADLLLGIRRVLGKLKDEYLANVDWSENFFRTVAKLEQDATRPMEGIPPGVHRTPDQRRTRLFGPRGAFQGSHLRSDLAGSASNPYLGFTLVELRKLNQKRGASRKSRIDGNKKHSRK